MKSGSKISKKRLWLVVLLGISLLFISSSAFAVTELRVMTVWGGKQKTWLDKFFEEYTKAHPGVKISHEVVAGAGAATYTEVLETGLGSGTGPDIYFNWGGELAGLFIDAGYAEPLRSYYKKYNWDKTLIPWAVDAIKRHDKVWGVPVATHAMSFWYRVDLWEKLGLSEPQTYEELENLCKKTSGGGMYPLSSGGVYGWMVMRLVDYLLEVTCGPELHDSLNNLEANWNRPEVVQAYDLFKKWVDKPWIVPGFMSIKPGDATLALYRGRALMVLEGSWEETQIKQDGQDVKNYNFFLHPTNHQPLRLSGFPEQLMMSSACEDKEAAGEFLNWFIQPGTQNEMLGKAMTSTATLGVEPNREELPRTYKWRKVIEGLKGVFPPTDQAFPPELMHYYFEVQNGIATGKVTPQEGARKMQESIEKWKAEQAAEE